MVAVVRSLRRWRTAGSSGLDRVEGFRKEEGIAPVWWRSIEAVKESRMK